MSRSPATTEDIVEARKKITDDTEPLHTERMSAHYDGNSLVVGLTHFGCTVHSIDDSDTLTVETYDDGIWIPLDD